MSTPMQAQLHRGCCFIVPPEILKELSLNQRLRPQNAKMYQDSYLETMRRTASLNSTSINICRRRDLNSKSTK